MAKLSFFIITLAVLAVTGCAALNMGWYKPGVSVQEFNQDKFACMNGSQMQVSTSTVNGRGPTYYGGANVTCNTLGSTTNCSGGGGYSQPGYVSGSSASYVTTNMPLFQACMQARGYVWTSQAEVNREEDSSGEDASPAEDASPEEQQASSYVTNGADVDASEACREMDELNKGFAAGAVTRQQFDAKFLVLMKACDGESSAEQGSPAEQASSYDASASDVDTSGACRRLDDLNKGFAAGTVTRQQFDAKFLGLMKACDGSP